MADNLETLCKDIEELIQKLHCLIEDVKTLKRVMPEICAECDKK